MIVLILGMQFLLRSSSIFAALMTPLSIALLNDSFEGTFSEKVTRTAAKMRPPLTPVILQNEQYIHICGRPRWVFVLVFSAVSFILLFVSCGIVAVLRAFAIGLHGTLCWL